MEVLLKAFFENFESSQRNCLHSRHKRKVTVDYFNTLIEGCILGENSDPQKVTREALISILRFHENSKRENGNVCLMGKYHDILYIGLKLCYDWQLKDTGTVATLLENVYSCEKTFERILVGAIFGTTAPYFIAGWKSDFEDQETNVRALVYFMDHAAHANLEFLYCWDFDEDLGGHQNSLAGSKSGVDSQGGVESKGGEDSKDGVKSKGGVDSKSGVDSKGGVDSKDGVNSMDEVDSKDGVDSKNSEEVGNRKLILRFIDIPIESCGKATALRILIQLGLPDKLHILLRFGASVLSQCDKNGEETVIEILLEKLSEHKGRYPYNLVACVQLLLRAIPSLEVRGDRTFLGGSNVTRDLILEKYPFLVEDCIIPLNRCGILPPNLKHLCRCKVREALWMNHQLPHGIRSLPVPDELHKYIDLLED